MSGLPDPVVLAAGMILLGLLPFLAIVATSFTKIVVVFLLLRQALGIQQVPPNMVLNGIALILSVYVMAPTATSAYEAMRPTLHSTSAATLETFERAANAGAPPLKDFLAKHTSDRYRRFFVKTAQDTWNKEQAASLRDTDLIVLIPSFVMTELTQAFQIGFMLFLLFLVIDLLVANVLLTLGMAMLSPTIISTPFKLLLFVALDGWARLVEALISTYTVAR